MTGSELVSPGDAGSIVYTFDESGDYQYFCSMPNHFALGMRGTITISTGETEHGSDRPGGVRASSSERRCLPGLPSANRNWAIGGGPLLAGYCSVFWWL